MIGPRIHIPRSADEISVAFDPEIIRNANPSDADDYTYEGQLKL